MKRDFGRRIVARVMRMSPVEEVDSEFDFHVEMRVRDNLGRGMSWKEARADAVERFGNLDRVKAVCRDIAERREAKKAWRDWIAGWTQDVRFAFRQIRKRPGFALLAILTLTIGIGANTAVFSVVNGVLLRPLPFNDAGRLVGLYNRYLPESGYDWPRFPLSLAEVLDYRDQTEAMASVGYHRWYTASIVGEQGEPQRVDATWVNKDVFPLLGVRPALGRWFTAEEDLPGASRAAILSHELWKRRFGSDPDVVGRRVMINGVTTEVIGVMPDGFGFPFESTRLYLTMQSNESVPGDRGNHGTRAIGRLAAGHTLETATAELETMMAAWARDDDHHTAHSIYPLGFQDHMVEGVRDTLWALMAAVALVLMIAGSNVANLMLARGESRTREISIRVALGAGRARIARQLLTESLVLAGAGGTLGVGLAWLGLKGMLAINPSALPRMNEIGVSLPVLAFTGVVSVGTALVFGLVPALLAGRKAVSSGLSDIRATDGKSRKRFRQVLITAEVALSLVVVLSAGLVVRSFRTLMNVDSGMNTESVLTFGVSLPFADYESAESVLNFYDQFLDRVNALSGADRASFVHLLPLTEGGRHTDILIEGRSAPGQSEAKWNAAHYMVRSGYLETTRIPLKSGRAFRASDGPGSELVALVSEEAARVFWPGDNPVGKRFGYEENDPNNPSLVTVVGVVGDVKVGGLDIETRPQIYVLQNQTERLWGFTARTGNVLVRAGVKPESLVPAVRSVLANLDPSLPMANVRTMSDVISSSVARPRLAANLLASFALVALVLAAVGVYGVVSYSVARRTREIGIRLALGANSVRVVRMMVHEGVGPALLGIVVGLIVAFGATVALEGMLFGVSRTDPFTFIAIPATLLIVAIVASWIPSTQATRVDPTTALRTE